jgi:DNA-binding CsgD family transcriptional regulator
VKVYFNLLALIVFNLNILAKEQPRTKAIIQGQLKLDESWRHEVYLSYIGNMEEMYSMNSSMIVDRARLDSMGNFIIQMNYLPPEPHLYRMHIVKKGDTPATLIIGGKDENHFFLILNATTNIQLVNQPGMPPFKKLAFTGSTINSRLQEMNSFIVQTDSIASESTQAKREFLEEALNKRLLSIADTTDHFLLSLFALYKSKLAVDFQSNEAFMLAYLDKWSAQESSYYKSLQARFPQLVKQEEHFRFYWLLIIPIIAGFVFYLWNGRGKDKFKALSLQERKVYDLLKEGMSNQEIADSLNIGVSTVKSHLTSIYSKLGVKSRKALVDFD